MVFFSKYISPWRRLKATLGKGLQDEDEFKGVESRNSYNKSRL